MTNLARSTSGWVVLWQSAALSWGSRQQKSIALSSCEAEIMAASQAGLEAIYLRSLLSDLGIALKKSSDLYVDNKGVIDMSHDYISNERTTYICSRDVLAHARAILSDAPDTRG